MTKGFLQRVVVALIILAVTLCVSVIWQKMVYTIPVLGVLLFLAAGLKTDAGTSRQNLDEDVADHDVDAG